MDELTTYEDLNEKEDIGPMASLGDWEITDNCYEGHAERVARLAETATAEGPERVPTQEWAEYLAAVDVNDGQTPHERLAEYFW